MATDSAISVGRFVPWSRSTRFSASSRWLRRSARASSTCVRTTASTRSLSQGFWMKSRAPRRMASTASSTVPQAVMTTTGMGVSSAWSFDSSDSPSRPEVVSRV